MPNYIATYIVTGLEIDVIADDTQPLSTYLNKSVYFLLNPGPTGTPYALFDINKFLVFNEGIDISQSVLNFISTLTDLQLAGYSDVDIPFKDPHSGAFNYRINAVDAYITEDLLVEYTSVSTPDIRNDIYEKNYLNDLVVSSSTNRDFSNCLCAVNGVFHQTEYFNNELYVVGGFSNIKISNKNKVILYDTSTLGGHTIVPISDTNIDVSNNMPGNGVTLSFPNQDFTNKTILLVIGGYLFPIDSTYQLININRLLINTCKIDFINLFLNDPNTITTKLNASPIIQVPPLTVEHEIEYYLNNEMYNLASNGPVMLANYFYDVPTDVTLLDKMNFFLTQYSQYQPTPYYNAMWARFFKYTLPTDIYKYRQIYDFKDPLYIYYTLMKNNSFLVVINNPNVFIKKYKLHNTAVPTQYRAYKYDKPRGLLRYNRQMSLPYLIYTEGDNNYHNVSIDYYKTTNDLYKTVINPAIIPSPVLDTKSYHDYPVELLEIYGPAPS